jgi:hypothetical protein
VVKKGGPLQIDIPEEEEASSGSTTYKTVKGSSQLPLTSRPVRQQIHEESAAEEVHLVPVNRERNSSNSTERLSNSLHSEFDALPLRPGNQIIISVGG